MIASRLLKIMRRDLAEIRRYGITGQVIEWETHTSTGPVYVDTVTLADLWFFAAVLAGK